MIKWKKKVTIQKILNLGFGTKYSLKENYDCYYGGEIIAQK